MAFGFNHPATILMLALIYEESFKKRAKRALDIGCGSGILSILLSKANINKVYGIDIDPYVLREAKKNFRDNIKRKRAAYFILKDIFFLKRNFYIITANIPINVHTLVATDIKRLLHPKGYLFCGGILKSQVNNFLSLYPDFNIKRMLEKDDWFAVKLERK